MAHKNLMPAYIKLAFAAVMWGISFIAIKLAVNEVSPIVVIWLRFAIGFLVLLFILLFRRQLKPVPLKNVLYFALLGFIGITFHQWLQSTGLVTSQASTTSWLVSTSPIFFALLGWLFLHEKLDLPVFLGIALATLGVGLVVSKGELHTLFSFGFGAPGDMLVLLSAPNWAVFSILSRRPLQQFPALFVLFYVVLFGWLFANPAFLLVRGWTQFPQLSLAGWLAVIFLGVACTALAYTFWYDGLQAVPASQAGAFLYIEPLVSLLVAAVILGETITMMALLGGGLILAGVWLVNHV